MTEQAAGLIGSPMVVPEDERFLHNQRLGLAEPKPGAPWHPRFFFHLFNTEHFRSHVHASASGVKVRHTSPKKMGAIKVAYPLSVREQERIARMLDELHDHSNCIRTLAERKLAALEELKQSLLHRAFRGEFSGSTANTTQTTTDLVSS